MEATLKRQGFRSRIHARAARGRPLSKVKAAANRAKSRIRARIEHVFGAQETAPGGRIVRTIGIVRARIKIGLQNFTYNVRRLANSNARGPSLRLTWRADWLPFEGGICPPRPKKVIGGHHSAPVAQAASRRSADHQKNRTPMRISRRYIQKPALFEVPVRHRRARGPALPAPAFWKRPTGERLLVKKLARRLFNLVRRLFNIAGLDICRADGGRPRWSGIVDDYYPVNFQPRWGHGRPSHPQIMAILEARITDYQSTLANIQRYRKHFAAVPLEPQSEIFPYWNNGWFGTLDAATLMYFIMSRKPKTYVEVGSGNSTKFAHYAISSESPQTNLTSLDPEPRSQIDRICTEIIRSPLEDLDLSLFNRLDSGDIAFLDGSHRIFSNSDTTAFYMDVLPRLRSGVLVHVHDIFWPDDYPPKWNNRLYSEQYVLGGLIIGGMSKFEIIMPNYFVSTNPQTVPLLWGLGIPTDVFGTANSFWFEVN